MDDKAIKDLTYSQAVKELEASVAKMRSDDCDIDQLTALVQRASALLAHCRSLLTTTEQSLNAALEQLPE